MLAIVLNPIRLSFRLLFQFYFQPSNLYDFIKMSHKNGYIVIWSFFLSGFLLGILLAIPYFILHQDIFSSILFAVSGALTFTVAIALAGTMVGAFSFIIAAAVAISGPGTFTIAFAVAGAFAGAVSAISKSRHLISNAFTLGLLIFGALAFVGLIVFSFGVVLIPTGVANLLTTLFPLLIGQLSLLFLAIIAVVTIYLSYEEKDFKINDITVQWILLITWFFILLIGARIKIKSINDYEKIIYPFAFLAGYLFSSTFYFKDKTRSYLNFGKAQRSSAIWGPLVAFVILLIDYFRETGSLRQEMTIMAWGFALMPLLILHVPDYLFCLPIWLRQRRNILENRESSKEMLNQYEHSILFKHERLYLQLPGLHRVIFSIAQQAELGINEAVERINYLNQHTFQQKQAGKAIRMLVMGKKTGHQFIHFLLERKSLPLLEEIAEPKSLAELYLMLLDESKKGEEIGPAAMIEGLEKIYLAMTEKQGYKFNEEIVKNLKIAHKFLTANRLKNLFEACSNLEKTTDLPGEFTYFRKIRQLVPYFRKIKEDLIKTESIERFESRRSFLKLQKESFQTLAKTAGVNLFEPFQGLWRNVLIHCSKVVEQEIEFLLNSAALSIKPKNNEILMSKDERKLYLNIRNKGKGLASDIFVKLETDNPGISFLKTTNRIPVIEPEESIEIFFPFSAAGPATVGIRGTVNFSDMVKENKMAPFSFPVTISEIKRSDKFTEITNPYVVGPPLTKDNSLFFGREDVYKYIDKNIIASGERHTIVCYGLRRTGKTSLLYKIEREGFTDKRLVPIIFDILGINDERDFYHELGRIIMKRFSLRRSYNLKNFRHFKQFLREIESELGEKMIVLMVDEFEKLLDLVEEKKISKTIFSNIRYLMQAEKKMVFLFCGTHQLKEISADYESMLFSTALFWKISHLEKEEAIRLIMKPVEGQLTYDSLAIDQILKMTNGQPFLTQLVCRTLVNDLNENKKRNYVVIDDVDDAVEEIISGENDSFSREIWQRAGKLERLILCAAAEELTDKQLDHIGKDIIFKRIRSITADSSEKQKADTLRNMVSKEILAETNMFYSFPINLLRKWIVFRYPLMKVREEI